MVERAKAELQPECRTQHKGNGIGQCTKVMSWLTPLTAAAVWAPDLVYNALSESQNRVFCGLVQGWLFHTISRIIESIIQVGRETLEVIRSSH